MTKNKFKQLQVNDRFTGPVPLEFSKKDDDKAIPDVIHMVPIGQWEHDLYGPIIITNSDIREFAQNFNAEVRKGVYITAGHEGFDELPAVGWMKDVEVRDDGLWGRIEWNQLGIDMLEDKQFKFFSPELCRDYEDPQNHTFYRNVITGGALTKSPYFKELKAIVFSDKNIKSKFNEENNNMNLKDLLAKDVSELTDEEKAFIKANKADLTEEEKIKVTSIIDEPSDESEKETEEEKTAREKKETEDANIAAGLNADGSEKTETQEHSDKKKVMISASELSILKTKADQGQQAFAELEKMKVGAEVDKLVFSESNKAGVFFPKSKDSLRAFMEKLSEKQRLEFSTLMKSVTPMSSEKFKESGENNGVSTTAFAEVESKIAALQKADPKLPYSDALKTVFAENKGLEERYDSELTPVGKNR